MHKNTILLGKKNDKQKQQAVKKVSILCAIINFCLCILKMVVGMISNSQAMIADAIHSFEDITSSLVALIGAKVSTKKVDALHPFGFGKAEYIFSLLISIFMLLASVTMIKSAIFNIISLEKMEFSGSIVILCIINIIVKIFLYCYVNIKFKQTGNILIQACKEDQRNDILITFSILVSSLFSFIGIFWLDYLLGIIISFWLGFTGIKIFHISYSILIDTGLTEYKLDEIKKKVLLFDEVKKVEQIIGKPVGSKYVIILKIAMERKMRIDHSHDVQKEIKKMLLLCPNIQDVIIHVNPFLS